MCAASKYTITEFRGAYAFLSNFYESPMTFCGVTYQSAEAAFQAQKCLTEAEKQGFAELTPIKAKRRGRQVTLRPNWDEVKLDLMEKIVRIKFAENETLKNMLLATGDAELQEGNTWNDTFWGVDLKTGNGKNHLGKILMKVRDEFAEQTSYEVYMENKEEERATADSWSILPVTGDSVTKELDFLLTDHQMQQIAMGHIPDAMEDHWFMYCDDQCIRYYRSWTGRCAFIAKYKKIDSGYKICELTIPDDDLRKKGAENINFDALSMMFLSLLMDECGGDSEYYWKKYRELKELQQGIYELKNN